MTLPHMPNKKIRYLDGDGDDEWSPSKEKAIWEVREQIRSQIERKLPVKVTRLA